MSGDDHVGGLGFKRLVDALGIGFLQMIDVEAAIARLLQFGLGAEIGPGGVVELEIAAAGGVKRFDGLLIRNGQVIENRVAVRIGGSCDRTGLKAKVHHCRRRNAHLWRLGGVAFKELEVLEHRMVRRKVDFACNLQHLHLGLHALELDAVVGHFDRDAFQHAVEIIVPERAAVFAVGDGVQADVFLLLDDLDDLRVLNLFQLIIGDLALLVLGARFVNGLGAQNAADMVGAEWRFCSLGHCFLRSESPPLRRVRRYLYVP